LTPLPTERVTISQPLVGDEKRIGGVLGIPPQGEGMTFEENAAHDAKWRCVLKTVAGVPHEL
jgi:hypothetical protein